MNVGGEPCKKHHSEYCTHGYIKVTCELCAKDAETAALKRQVEVMAKRLSQEITWGHRNCTPDNCVSSGIDCPANEAEKGGAG
jgi:hypothetical protein